MHVILDRASEGHISRVCKVSRWKVDGNHQKENILLEQGILAKVLRYFPLKPRLQRLFLCLKTARHMTWHATERPKDGKLRHPADAQAWKDFDSLDHQFASEL